MDALSINGLLLHNKISCQVELWSLGTMVSYSNYIWYMFGFIFSVKKASLKNVVIFWGKRLSWSLFLIKLQKFRAAALLKKILQHLRFSVNIAKILRTPILKEEHMQTAASVHY